MGGRQVLKRDEGSATVEFFLVLPLLVVVLVGALQVVSLVAVRTELAGAVREGARVAATSPDPARAVGAVRDALPASVRDRVRVSVSRPGVPGRPARVTARFRHLLGPPFPSQMGVDLSVTASMLVER